MSKIAIARCCCGVPNRASPSKQIPIQSVHPTPPDLMRELNTDRPDKTEGPYTVDAGHVQIEMDLASYTYDRRNPQHEARRFQSLDILPSNFKHRAADNLEFISSPTISSGCARRIWRPGR
jgi:hypothetical protein